MYISFPQILMVFLGAGLGGVSRFVFGLIAKTYFTSAFPIGTFFVNIFGGLLIGICAALLNKGENSLIQFFVITGFLGGFTTFSAFSLETIKLLQNGNLMLAIVYIIASVALSLLAVLMGMAIIKNFG